MTAARSSDARQDAGAEYILYIEASYKYHTVHPASIGKSQGSVQEYIQLQDNVYNKYTVLYEYCHYTSINIIKHSHKIYKVKLYIYIYIYIVYGRNINFFV